MAVCIKAVVGFIVDTYVVWCNNKRQKKAGSPLPMPTGTATAIVGGNLLLAVVNIVQIILVLFGVNILRFVPESEISKIIVLVGFPVIGAALLKWILRSHPDLQSSEEIEARFKKVRTSRRIAIYVAFVCNMIMPVAIWEVDAKLCRRPQRFPPSVISPGPRSLDGYVAHDHRWN